MSKKRVLAIVATAGVAVAGAAAAIIPMTSSNAAAACAPAYSSSATYVGGSAAVSHNGRNWQAKWWTSGEAPSTGGSGVWADKGACGNGGGNNGGNNGGGNNGGGTVTPPPNNGNTGCNHPAWGAGTWYNAGAVVKYTNGQYYRAKNANPGYDPVISTWYWEPTSCTGGGNTGGGNTGGGTVPPPVDNGGGNTSGFPVSEAQFNQMFPNRIPFYTYAGLVEAAKKYSAFTGTGDATMKKREAAAFLANINHESGGLRYVEELNQAVWGSYCDTGRSYGCPAGQTAYHGRGPIQLSWNYNYKLAGDALGMDLLGNPDRVKNEPAVAMATAVWYWMTQTGPNSITAHAAITGGGGFGGTIRSINGTKECNGGNPAQVQSRIDAYQSFSKILGVDPGSNLSC